MLCPPCEVNESIRLLCAQLLHLEHVVLVALSRHSERLLLQLLELDQHLGIDNLLCAGSHLRLHPLVFVLLARREDEQAAPIVQVDLIIDGAGIRLPIAIIVLL